MSIDLEMYAQIVLSRGGHSMRSSGLCLMEAAALIAGEKHSDHPGCVSYTLTSFGIGLNDQLPDDLRQELKQHIPALIGTRDDGLDVQRKHMSFDWLARTWLPTFLDLPADSQCAEAAQQLRDLGAITDRESVCDAVQLVEKVCADVPGSAGNTRYGTPVGSSMYYPAVNAAYGIPFDGSILGGRKQSLLESGLTSLAGHAIEASTRDVDATVRELQLSAIGLYGDMIKA
jgi:hypothetical protein